MTSPADALAVLCGDVALRSIVRSKVLQQPAARPGALDANPPPASLGVENDRAVRFSSVDRLNGSGT
jgi:hypothetical protein